MRFVEFIMQPVIGSLSIPTLNVLSMKECVKDLISTSDMTKL